MNSINMNGVNNLSSLRNTACVNFASAPQKPESSSLPEQHDMVSLGQGTSDLGVSTDKFSSAQISGNTSNAKADTSISDFAPATQQNNSVDAGNGLRATMSDLGVLTMLEDPSIEALSQSHDIQASGDAEMRNTLAMINMNSMASILSEGLIAF